jgi:hypothetical protein
MRFATFAKRTLSIGAIVASILWCFVSGRVATQVVASKGLYIGALVEIIPFACLFFSVRWSLRLSGHTKKVGQRALAWIVLGYASAICAVFVSVIVLVGFNFNRKMAHVDLWFFVFVGIPVLSAVIVYGCFRWLKRLNGQETTNIAKAL